MATEGRNKAFVACALQMQDDKGRWWPARTVYERYTPEQYIQRMAMCWSLGMDYCFRRTLLIACSLGKVTVAKEQWTNNVSDQQG